MTTITYKNFTTRQWDILYAVRKGAPDGGFLDMDQLLEAMLPTVISKTAMQFSVRYLIRHGVMSKSREKRRGYSRICYSLTPMAYLYLIGDPDVVVLELLKADGN